MSDNRIDETLFTRAELSAQWWIRRIKYFEGLRILPCHVLFYESDGTPLTWRCEPEFATSWKVYGFANFKDVPSWCEVFGSFSSEADAEDFCQSLIRRFPTLAESRRPAKSLSDNQFSK